MLSGKHIVAVLALSHASLADNTGIPHECAELLATAEGRFQDVSHRLLTENIFDRQVTNEAGAMVDEYVTDVRHCQKYIPDLLVIDGDNVFPHFSIDSVVHQFETTQLYIEAFVEGGEIGGEPLREHMRSKFSRHAERALKRINDNLQELRLDKP